MSKFITSFSFCDAKQRAQDLSGALNLTWGKLRDASVHLLAHLPPSLRSLIRHKDSASTEQRFQRLLHELSQDRVNLEPLSGEIEKNFIEISQRMEELSVSGGKLVARSEKLLSLSTGNELGKPALQSSIIILADPMAFAAEYRSASTVLVNTLEGCVTQISSMLGCEEQLNRAVAPLKYIRTLFKVESSELTHELQVMFVALTEEINVLQGQISTIFGEKFASLRSTRATLESVKKSLEGWAASDGINIDQKNHELAQAIEGLRANLQQNQDRDHQLNQASHAIADSISRLVVCLQSQDIVSQQIAHVLQAIRSIEERGKEISGQNVVQSPATRDHLGFVLQAATVEAAQLDSIQQELRKTEMDIVSAARAIQERMKSLDEEALRLPDLESPSASVNGLVCILVTALADVRTLVDTSMRSAIASWEAIRPIGGQTSDVTTTMRELSAQIHRIALNAQIQATQVGHGTGLEVLAAATADVARETGAVSEQLAAELDHLTGHVNEVVGQFDKLKNRGESGRTLWMQQTAEKERELHAFRDLTLQEMQEVGNICKEIFDGCEKMTGKISWNALAEKKAGVPADRLRALATCAKELLPPDAEGSGSLPVYVRTITMESERQTQNQALRSPLETGSGGTTLGLTEPGPLEVRAREGNAPAPAEGNVELF